MSQQQVTDEEDNTKSSLYSLIDFGRELLEYWQPRLMSYLWRPNEKAQLFDQLQKAPSFEEWHDVALKIDHLQGNDVWRSDPASPHYDYKLISSLVLKLEQLRRHGRKDELAEVVRSGLIRNMGSIAVDELYTRAYAGTKSLIESYIANVCESLLYLSESASASKWSVASPYPLEYAENRALMKTFFKNCQQSFGRTALILHGGSLFGLCHLGVIKGLLDNQLLPSVICGTTVGSIVAAYICSLPYDEIEDAIVSVPLQIMAYENTQIEPSDDEKATESRYSASEQLRHSLFTKDVIMFLKFVLNHLGDMTFEESYVKSGRILNILVLPAKSGVSTFYNYLVTPKVVVRSAILASIGSHQLSDTLDISLLIKDYEGNVCEHPDNPQEFLPANHKTFAPPRESPYTRLSELFNVNNYVVSISRPYFAPLLLTEFKYRGEPRLWLKLIKLARMSAQYRLGQLAGWGVLSPRLKSVFIDEMIPGAFQVNIVPETDALIRDLILMFDSTNIWQKVKHWIDMGERSVWPQISIISARSKIEYVLEQVNEEFN